MNASRRGLAAPRAPLETAALAILGAPPSPTHLRRLPGIALRPFVKMLWAMDTLPERGADRERVLPSGAAHIVFRLSDTPLRIFDDPTDVNVGRGVDHAVVGGARSSFYVRDVSLAVRSVGAQLYPGAQSVLLGVPADWLAERHTSLFDLWGTAAHQARERIARASTDAQRLDVFESILVARLSDSVGIHPAVAHALARFSNAETAVAVVVAESGYSHRRFIEIFRQTVGLSPKRYCRVARFQRALSLTAAANLSSSELASAAGYSDQAHMNREFVELGSLTPGRLRKLAPTPSNHLPIR